MAAKAFRRAGYDAYSVDGGLKEWDARGFPLEPPRRQGRRSLSASAAAAALALAPRSPCPPPRAAALVDRAGRLLRPPSPSPPRPATRPACS